VLTTQPSTEAQKTRRKSTLGGDAARPPSRRSTLVSGDGTRTRRETLSLATAKYYAPQTEHLSKSHHRNFARLLKGNGDDAPRVSIDHNELRRFSIVQVNVIFIFLF